MGSIAEARRMAYAAGAHARHEANGQPLQDPAEPRVAKTAEEPTDTCIVKAVIYPSIGVGRVGSSENDWFLGPEVPNPPPAAPGFYRDAEKKLKRQGARFRLYGVNARGQIIRELTADEAEIEWHMQLANTKSAWYGFQLALDIPEAASAPPTTLRNAAIPDCDKLAIRPGVKKVSGKNAPPQRFDDGKFMGKPVYLGEAFSDEKGRLIVLGGHGKSASYDGSLAITFANNEGWHDDISDGPITATVIYQGQSLARGAGLVHCRATQLWSAAKVGAHHVGSDARCRHFGRNAANAGAAELQRRHSAVVRKTERFAMGKCRLCLRLRKMEGCI